MAKTKFKKKGILSPEKLDLKFEEETSKMLFLDWSFVQFRNLYISEIRSEIPGKF